MQNFTEFINDLKTLISYKSYLSAPEKNAPFGKEVASALNYFLNRAKEILIDGKSDESKIFIEIEKTNQSLIKKEHLYFTSHLRLQLREFLGSA